MEKKDRNKRRGTREGEEGDHRMSTYLYDIPLLRLYSNYTGHGGPALSIAGS